MNCEEIKARLSDYLDGMLSRKEVQLVSDHLHSCKSCEKEARELSEISRLLGQIPQEPVPEVFWERLSQALNEEKKRGKNRTSEVQKTGKQGSFFGRKRMWRTGAAVAAVFVCVLSWSLFSDHLLLPDTGAGEGAPKHLNSEDGFRTAPPDSAQRSDEQKSADASASGITGEERRAAVSEEQGSEAGKGGSAKGDSAAGQNASAKGESSSKRESPAQKSKSSSHSALKSATSRAEANQSEAAGKSKAGAESASAPESVNAPTAQAPESAFAASGTGEPDKSLLRSRTLSDDSSPWAVLCDQTVSNLADAVNQKDLKEMEQAVSLAGYTDHLKSRARVALSFYESVFGGDPVSWEAVTEEPGQSAPDQTLRSYRLSNKNSALELRVAGKNGRPTVQEDILQYSYAIDQAMAGADYKLKAYKPENETGCPEFTLTIKGKSPAADQTVTFVGCDGKISRKDGTQPVSVNAPDNMEGN